MLQTSSYNVESSFLSELEALNLEPSSWKLTPNKRRRRRTEKKEVLNSEWNETQRWLFDPLENRFENLREYCIKTASQDASTGDLGLTEYEDLFMAWIADLAKRDTLGVKIKLGEKIQKSVLYWWYRQSIQRACMKSAQDVLARVQGMKTQSEITHSKAPQHNLKNMEENGFRVARVVHKIDEVSGETTGEPDYYVEGDFVDQIHAKSVNTAILNILKRSYDEETALLRFRLYEQMVEGKGGYENLIEWADSWDIPVSKLKHQISHIEKLILLNKKKLGY